MCVCWNVNQHLRPFSNSNSVLAASKRKSNTTLLYFLNCLRTFMWSSNTSWLASFTNQKLIYNLADPTNLGRLDSMPLHCSSSSFHVKMFLGLFFLLFLDVDINVMQCILVRKSTLATLCGTFPISLLYNPSTS